MIVWTGGGNWRFMGHAVADIVSMEYGPGWVYPGGRGGGASIYIWKLGAHGSPIWGTIVPCVGRGLSLVVAGEEDLHVSMENTAGLVQL